MFLENWTHRTREKIKPQIILDKMCLRKDHLMKIWTIKSKPSSWYQIKSYKLHLKPILNVHSYRHVGLYQMDPKLLNYFVRVCEFLAKFLQLNSNYSCFFVRFQVKFPLWTWPQYNYLRLILERDSYRL